MSKVVSKLSSGVTDAAALNIRNFPKDLLKKCKMRALQRDQPLRDFVIETLHQEVDVRPSSRAEQKQ